MFVGRPVRRWGAVEWYSVALIAAVVLLTFAVAADGARIGAPPWMLGALMLVAFLAEKQSVRISSHTETSVAVLPILFAAISYGPLAGLMVGGAAHLADLGRPHTRWLVWTSIRALAGGLAGLAAAAVLARTNSFGGLVLAVTAAAATEAFTNAALSFLTGVLRGHASRETVRLLGRLLVGTLPLYTPLIAVLVYAYEELSPWTVVFFFAPALAAQRLLLLYEQQRDLAENLSAANDRLERASLSFASALVSALDARDGYTAGHSAAVAVYARDIAERLGLPLEQQQLAHLCGLLHDIGKVGLPAGMLEKTGSLSLEEHRKMQEHSVIGEWILANVDDYAEVARVVRHHHERVDGNGYPDHLKGSDIPLLSRIIAVADAYNAMTSGRPYRDAMPSRVARLRLAQAVDTQFDTSVVAAFEAVLASAGESYRLGATADFAVEAQRHPPLGVEVVTDAA